ncbi:hypothetical protein QO3_3508, partial [Clostridioides difficile F249]
IYSYINSMSDIWKDKNLEIMLKNLDFILIKSLILQSYKRESR